MAKVPTLKPRIGVLDTRRLQTIQVEREGATKRTRGRKWLATRAKWFSKHPLCCMCEAEGRITLADEVDHIIPLWDGGLDSDCNYQSLCKEHHKIKTSEEAKRRFSNTS